MKNTLLFLVIAMLTASCLKDKVQPTPLTDNTAPNPYAEINNTFGYGILAKIKGIWNGPVVSPTALGSFPEWIVDFRPISSNQISSKNELDSLNDIHMSFFIAKYNDQYRVCFRNGGSFAGQTRVSYFLVDSVDESASHAFYRFTEIIKGKSRASTSVLFRNDSLIMTAYTNQYNTLSTPAIHMNWSAKLQDLTACQPATTNFNFPQKTLTKDFSSTFVGQVEAVYYSIGGGDPYVESLQPYLGKTTISYTYGPGLTPSPLKKVFLLITTQPLISGFTLNTANLSTRSRYVVLAANDQSYTFNYMHPGSYYVYAFYDSDGNGTANSGDWISTSNVAFSLANLGNTAQTTQINFVMP